MRMRLESGYIQTSFMLYLPVEVLVSSSASQGAGESVKCAASTVSVSECPISISPDLGVEDVPALVRISDALTVW